MDKYAHGKFNINFDISGRLTKRGWAIWHNLEFPHTKPEADGTFRAAMWKVMCDFGKDTYMGPEPPFETTIELHPDKPFKP